MDKGWDLMGTGLLVDVNSASIEVLRDEVNGIGQVLAERIVAYREEHGRFSTVSELIKVPGIGPASLRAFASQLTVEQADQVAEEVATGTQAAEAAEIAEPEVGESASEEARTERISGEEESGDVIPELESYLEDEEEPLEIDLEQDEAELAIGAPVEKREPPDVGAVSEADDGPKPAPPIEAPASRAQEEPAAAQRKTWHSALLVLLGGLLGVVLTLVAAIIWSGTVDFAPRRDVEALSQNMSTMQTNQELAWERIDEITLKAAELDRGLKRLEPLLGRVETLEKELQAAQATLDETRRGLAQTQNELEELRVQVREELTALDERMGRTEDALVELDSALGELQESFAVVQERVGKFDAFFAALRDLLVDLDGPPQEVAPAAQ